MTSKSLFFKLMREDWKRRLWAIALISLGSFFLYPVTAAFQAGEMKEYMDFQEGLTHYQEAMGTWLSFENGMTAFVLTAAALICGLSGFSYLNSKRQVDFYHSLPIGREQLFAANFINGILMLLIPYGVGLALAVIIAIGNGAEAWPLIAAAGLGFGLHLTYFILMYSTVTAAAMLTGNLVVAFLGSMVFAFLVPLAATVLQGYFATFFSSYTDEGGSGLFQWIVRFSPLTEYVIQIEHYRSGGSVAAASAAAWAASAVIAVLSLFFYRRRPSEAAGRAMAFSISRPLVRIPITVVSSLGLGLLFWSIRESTGWAVFGVICGGMIAHCVVEIIYHFDFKRLFSCKGQLLGCILASVAVLFVFRYDVLGYDRYLPKAGQVKSSAIDIYALNGWVDWGEIKEKPDGSYVWSWKDEKGWDKRTSWQNMKYMDTENVLNLAAAGVGQLQKEKREGAQVRQSETEQVAVAGTGTPEDLDRTEGEPPFVVSFRICYTLASGRKVNRRYTVPVDAVRSQLNRLMADQAYERSAFPLFGLEAEQVDTVHVRTDRNHENRLSGLSLEEKRELLDTWKKEFSALTVETMEKECPIGLIRFAGKTEEAGILWWEKQNESGFSRYPNYQSSSLGDMDYYPIYPSFRETLSLLNRHQVSLTSFLDRADITSVKVEWVPGDGSLWTADITEPEEIRQLKPLMVLSSLGNYDNLYMGSEASVTVMVSGEGGGEWSVSIPKGKVPEFVKKKLQAGSWR